MKKTLLLPILLLMLATIGKPQRAGAQITGITLYASDFLATSGCMMPATDTTGFGGGITGTPGPTDSVTLHVYFGDGSDTVFKKNIIYSGGYYSFNGGVSHNYYLPGAYADYTTASAPGGATASATSSVVNYINDTCATLSGRLYLDMNGNCAYDAGEPGMGDVFVYYVNTVTGDTLWGAMTDSSGNYTLNLVPGSFTILANVGLASGGNIAPSCPSSGTASITITTGGSYTEDFAFHCVTPTSVDMSSSLMCTHFVAGHYADLFVNTNDWSWFSDLTCTPLSATVTLTIDPRLTYLYSWLPAPVSVVGNIITWNINTTSEMWGLYSGIGVDCPTTLTLSDTICTTLSVTPTSLTDPDLSNNTITFCTPVSSSFDPNGISVSPAGAGAPGYIPNSTPLTYGIHFQNTGTAPATNITVDDTLSANVDMKSLHIFSASAPVDVSIVGNVVKFKFNNINLPDSATSPRNSIGTVTYGVMPKSGLAPGTQIKNKAGIYFDYNAPVATNTALNTIRSTTATQPMATATGKISVYPNPADEQIVVSAEGTAGFKTSLMDITGRVVTTVNTTGSTATVNTQNIPEGFYFVRINDAAGKESVHKVVVKH